MGSKCRGKAPEKFPGLTIESSIEEKSCTITPAPVDHKLWVTNASNLTYEVSFESDCGAGLYYVSQVGTTEENTWRETFTAPFRWDEKPRPTTRQKKLATKIGSPPMTDQEIDISVNCRHTRYRVGPFRIVLQVDTQG